LQSNALDAGPWGIAIVTDMIYAVVGSEHDGITGPGRVPAVDDPLQTIDAPCQISYARLTVKLSPQFDPSFWRFDGFPRKTDRT
jgi:hypothetical protein